jgi:DNA-binding NarL/FixJ family response regulator
MTRVLVVDDHPVVRSGLTAVLTSLDDFDVVGVAGNGPDAVREAVLLHPDVVLMDLHMPDGDGFSAIRELVRVAPDVRVCVLTMFDDDDSLFEAMRAGARGYLLKGAEQDDIARAVLAIADGEVIFAAGVASRVLGRLDASADRPQPFPTLTAREYDVLALLAGGHPTSVIAARLTVAPKTVSNHVSNILVKLHLADRTQAAMLAREAGLGDPP